MSGGAISAALIFSVIAAAGTLYNIWNDHHKNQEEENRKTIESEKNFIKLDIKMDNVLGATGSILEKQEKQAIKLEQMAMEIAKNDEKISTLFKYRDDHEERLKKLEHQ